VKAIQGGPGHMADADATALLSTLDDSYGMMGAKYAHFLATNHEAIRKELKAYSKQLQADWNAGLSDRYWIAGSAIMVLAAKYAAQLGVEVDPDEIEDFMHGVYMENRADRDSRGMTDGKVDSAESVLARYLKDRGAEERVIWTNYMHNKQGKPPKPVNILKGPVTPRNTAGGIEVRVAVENREIVIASSDFGPWVRNGGGLSGRPKHSLKQIEDGLKRQFGAYYNDKLKLCSGTIHATPLREPCFIIPVPDSKSPLWEYLMMWSPPDERAAAEADDLDGDSGGAAEKHDPLEATDVA